MKISAHIARKTHDKIVMDLKTEHPSFFREIKGIKPEAVKLYLLATDLYADIQDIETRSMVLHSMAIGEDVEGIIRIMRSEQNPDLRAIALQSLAISDDDDAAEFMVEMYPDATAMEKSAIIQAMMIMEDAERLIELMRQEQDSQAKRQMLQALSMMDSEEATDYLFEMMEESQ